MPFVDDAGRDAPLAFSGQRLGWADLPRAVRARIAELAGAQVTAEISATMGFSPGFAAVLELADGRDVFVKATSAEQNPDSPAQARSEVVAAAALPPELRVPRLLWSDDDGEWVLLGFEPVHGRTPHLPWEPAELRQVLAALVELAGTRPLPGHRLPTSPERFAGDFTGWRRIGLGDEACLSGPDVPEGLAGWVRAHRADLAAWESQAPAVMAGDRIVHGDLRQDNVMLDHEHTAVWLIDWTHASVGAPWLDLAFFIPSLAMQGAGDPQQLFWSHDLSTGVPREDLRAVVAGLAGYFCHAASQPDPPGLPNLRDFQRAQGLAALTWLRALA